MRPSMVLAVAPLFVASNAALSSRQIVTNINQITAVSSETNDIARSISFVNFFSTGPQLVNNFRQIVTIVINDITAMQARKLKRRDGSQTEGFDTPLETTLSLLLGSEDVPGSDEQEELAGTVEQAASGGATARAGLVARQATAPFAGSEQQAICDAFRGFVRVHQALLNTVIGKYGILSTTPFTLPIAQVLRILEGGVDTIAFSIIDAVPTCAASATTDKNSLDRTLAEAIRTYGN